MFPEPGTGVQVRERLDGIRGCETALADDGRVILLVADAVSGEDEARIRAEVDAIDDGPMYGSDLRRNRSRYRRPRPGCRLEA